MKGFIVKYLSISIVFIFLIACSVKKDKFVNRNFHAVTTKYNILYNGNLALEAGKEEVIKTYKDNFWEILPVERISDKDEQIMPGQSKNANFEKAEEKAVKAIQKHSMNIQGSEKNPQMDEAYLLLAKARYYDNRFLPALEALNYILYKYPKSDKIYHAKVWREKVNIRLENDETAIVNLKKLLEDKKIEGQDLADANAMLTQAYLNIGSKDSAIATIKIARKYTHVKEERARYSFILGQLYESFGYKDSAAVVFQEVIDMNRKAPRRYVIQSHAHQALQFDYQKGDTILFLEKFEKLIEDRENRPYLDILYHQKGVFYDSLQKNKEARKFYNRSLRTVSQDKYLVASNYRNIAEIYFREAVYKKAGMYYDSTLTSLNNKTKEYRKIKKKRDNLEDVIRYEDIAKVNDSVLRLVKMSENEREVYFNEIIEKLKKEDAEKAKLAAEKAEKESQTSDQGTGTPPGFGSLLPPSGADTKNTFYFYNPTTVAYGKKEFRQKWGKRKLEDNWRISSLSADNLSVGNEEDQESVSNVDSLGLDLDKEEYKLEFYLSKIPTEKKIIDSIHKERNFAYFQLGVIYKEKFKEYKLSIERFTHLLKNNPEQRLILPTKYHLYKIYQLLGDVNNQQKYKNEILSEYPDSRYTQIIQNPTLEIKDDADPNLVYSKLFREYEEGNVREVSVKVEEYINQYEGEEILPKFESLKARVLARLEGIESYKKALNHIAVSYPDNDEGKWAEFILQNQIPKLEGLSFSNEEAVYNWKLVFPKDITKKEETEKLIKVIQKYLEARGNDEVYQSQDIFTKEVDFIVIHGFLTKELAESTLSVLQEYKDYRIKDEYFIISTDDYKVIQIKKELKKQ